MENDPPLCGILVAIPSRFNAKVSPVVKAQQGCKLPPLPEKLPLGGGFFCMDCVPTQLSSSISLPDLPGKTQVVRIIATQ